MHVGMDFDQKLGYTGRRQYSEWERGYQQRYLLEFVKIGATLEGPDPWYVFWLVEGFGWSPIFDEPSFVCRNNRIKSVAVLRSSLERPRTTHSKSLILTVMICTGFLCSFSTVSNSFPSLPSYMRIIPDPCSELQCRSTKTYTTPASL